MYMNHEYKRWKVHLQIFSVSYMIMSYLVLDAAVSDVQNFGFLPAGATLLSLLVLYFLGVGIISRIKDGPRYTLSGVLWLVTIYINLVVFLSIGPQIIGSSFIDISPVLDKSISNIYNFGWMYLIYLMWGLPISLLPLALVFMINLVEYMKAR